MNKAQTMVRELTEALNVSRNTEGASYGPAWKRVFNLIGALDDEVSRMVDPYEKAMATYEAQTRAMDRADRSRGYDVYRDEALTLEHDEQVAKEISEGL